MGSATHIGFLRLEPGHIVGQQFPPTESSSPQPEKPCSREGKNCMPFTCKPSVQHIVGALQDLVLSQLRS